MTLSIKDRVVQIHADNCNLSLREVAAKAGCSVPRVSQIFDEYGLRRYSSVPDVGNHYGSRKSLTPHVLHCKPIPFVAVKPTYAVCQRIHYTHGALSLCGREKPLNTRHLCKDCEAELVPKGRRYSLLESTNGKFA